MDDAKTRMFGALALVGLLLMIGGCAYGAHLEHAQAEGAEQGEPRPIPAQHAAAGQAQPQFEPVDPAPTPAFEPEPAPADAPADQFAQAQQAPPAPQAAPAGQGRTYTVRDGDTLWSIAESNYGDGQMWRDIVDANPDLNHDELRVGQEITLP